MQQCMRNTRQTQPSSPTAAQLQTGPVSPPGGRWQQLDQQTLSLCHCVGFIPVYPNKTKAGRWCDSDTAGSVRNRPAGSCLWSTEPHAGMLPVERSASNRVKHLTEKQQPVHLLPFHWNQTHKWDLVQAHSSLTLTAFQSSFVYIEETPGRNQRWEICDLFPTVGCLLSCVSFSLRRLLISVYLLFSPPCLSQIYVYLRRGNVATAKQKLRHPPRGARHQPLSQVQDGHDGDGRCRGRTVWCLLFFTGPNFSRRQVRSVISWTICYKKI